MKCDIRKYSLSIDHQILEAILEKTIQCWPTLDLAKKIIRGSNPQEAVHVYFPGDNLFTPHERRSRSSPGSFAVEYKQRPGSVVAP